MTRIRERSTLSFQLVIALAVMMVFGTAAVAYSAPPGAQAAATAEIRGVKYHDRDYDGVKDPGEEGLAGWAMILTSATRPGWQTTATTGVDGAFAFTGLTPATYAMTEIEKSGWHNTNGLPHYVTVREGEIATTDNAIGSVQDRAELTLTRSASPTTYRSAGDAITFTYVVRNTGNIGFHPPFSIVDDKVQVTFPNIQTLAPHGETTFTAVYTVTQADVDAGYITSTAIAHVVGFVQSNMVKITCAKSPVDTQLLISASDYDQRRRQRVTIYTRLDCDAPLQFVGCQALFQVKRPGSKTWVTVVRKMVSSTTGKANYRTTLNTRGTYQWRTKFLGSDGFEAATSRTIRIRVR